MDTRNIASLVVGTTMLGTIAIACGGQTPNNVQHARTNIEKYRKM